MAPRPEQSSATNDPASVRLALEQAFAELLPALARWAARRLPPSARRRCDPWDLVQDACLGAITHLRTLRSGETRHLEAYLRRSIRNRICDEVRRSRKVETAWSDAHDRDDTSPSPHALAVAAEERQRLLAAAADLPEIYRQLVVGRLELGLSYEELARLTGRSLAAVRRAASRAVARLGQTLARPLPRAAARPKRPVAAQRSR